MDVSRWLLFGSKRNETVNEDYEINKSTMSHQVKRQLWKTKKIINNIISETFKALGKTISATVITATIVISTDLIGYANSNRPSFAIGGEWILIIGVFCGVYYLISIMMSKNKKATQQK